MCRILLCVFVVITGIIGCLSELMMIPRAAWEARPPVAVEPMKNPVPYVIVHHSYIPGECNSESECVGAMQQMQNMHQLDRGWNDIGYSFAVGGDGNIYEGRGWSNVGAHAPGYNNKSIGICTIGDWTVDLPPERQLNAIHHLIEYGIDNGYIMDDYQLLGHRQVRDTECPGDRLFAEVQLWKNFINKPSMQKSKSNAVEDNKLFFFKEKS